GFILSIWAAPRVESKSRITARGVVSFLQVNDSEAQAKIFYGSFYGRAKSTDQSEKSRQNQACISRYSFRSASLNGITRLTAPLESRTRISPDRKHARDLPLLQRTVMHSSAFTMLLAT